MLQLSDKWGPKLASQREMGVGYQLASIILKDGTHYDQAVIEAGYATRIRSFERGSNRRHSRHARQTELCSADRVALCSKPRGRGNETASIVECAAQDRDYDYDGVGNVTAITDQLGGHADSVSMSYDAATARRI